MREITRFHQCHISYLKAVLHVEWSHSQDVMGMRPGR